MNNNQFKNLKSFNSQNSLKYKNHNKQIDYINNFAANSEDKNIQIDDLNKNTNKNKTEKI